MYMGYGRAWAARTLCWRGACSVCPVQLGGARPLGRTYTDNPLIYQSNRLSAFILFRTMNAIGTHVRYDTFSDKSLTDVRREVRERSVWCGSG